MSAETVYYTSASLVDSLSRLPGLALGPLLAQIPQ